MATTWEIIERRRKNLSGFYNQIDKTRKRLKMENFKLTTFDGKHYLDDVVNVTENKSVSYVARIIASLMSSKWQTTIEGDISQRDAHKVEKILERNLEQADEYINDEYGIADLDSWLCNHVCHTSLIGVQWMSYLDDETGEYKIHCLPVDMRWCPFVMGKWAAPTYFRDKEDLEVELEDYARSADGEIREFHKTKEDLKALLKNKNNEVRDYWDENKGELWINKELVYTQPNYYGKPPFVIVWTPSGFMMRDKDYLDYESPSLLFLNEKLYDQLSRQLSSDATLGFDPVLPAYEYETKQPTGGLSRPVSERGESLEVPEGELHKLLPRSDINNAAMASRTDVNRMIDEASPITPRAYTQPPSAVEVATEVELLDELQNPRFKALKTFKEKLGRMIIYQMLKIATGEVKAPLMAGKEGRKVSFSAEDLKDPDKYFVHYVLMKENKRLAIVNEARALALWGKAPRKYILRDILSVEDPDGWEREMELDMAREANPALRLAEMAIRYAEEAEDMEQGVDKDLKNHQSKMLVHMYVQQMKQQMGQVSDEGVETTGQLRDAISQSGNANALINLTGRGGDGRMAATPQGGQDVGQTGME